MFRNRFATVCFICSTLAASFANQCVADSLDHAAPLAPFVNDDTFAAAYIDLGSLKVAENAGKLFQLLPEGTSDMKSWLMDAAMADSVIQRFRQAGGKDLYVVVGLGDLHLNGGPVGIVTTRPGQDPAQLEKFCRDLIREFGGKGPHDARSKIDVLRKDDVVLLGTKPTVGRYAALKSAPRRDLLEPLTKLVDQDAMAAAVFCPGPDFRRVVRELWPELPGVLAPLKSDLADRWLYLTAAINQPPNPKPRIALQAKDDEAVATFVKLWCDLPTAITQFGGNEKSIQQAKGYAQLLVDSLPAKVEGTRVSLQLTGDPQQLAKLGAEFVEAVAKSRGQRQRVKQFKQLALAMINYADVHKHYPPAAIYDKSGKPLLSWRVAILPYLDQGNLYKQFHVDEPWDSPHNRSLIQKIPAIYVDPDPNVQSLIGAGRTTYEVPVGAETVFHDKIGTTFHDVTDGTVKTILTVEVDPAHAVEWTKPADWEVDLEHPRRGLEQSGRQQFVVAWCDGSVQMVPIKVDEANLRAYLTRAGQEIVDRP